MDDWSDAFGFDDGPDKKREAADGHEDCFDGEEMTDLMHGEPDGGEAAEPEEEETEEIPGGGVGTGRQGIGEVLIFGPDGSDHERDALSSDPRLYAVPDACHRCAVEDWPEGAPDAEGGPAHDWEADVICCSDASCQADEAAGDEVSYPYTEPRLPP